MKHKKYKVILAYEVELSREIITTSKTKAIEIALKDNKLPNYIYYKGVEIIDTIID